MPRKLSQQRETVCAICMSLLKNPSNLDSCGHLFCFRCIRRWAKRQNTCPICRLEFHEITSKNRRVRLYVKTPEVEKPQLYLGIPIFTVVLPTIDSAMPAVWPLQLFQNTAHPFYQFPGFTPLIPSQNQI